MEINKKSLISTASGGLLRSTIRFGSRNAAVIQNPLIKGKDFDDNVEAHESTCDTWPAG